MLTGMTDVRKRRHVVEYANLTVTFGNKDLLDYIEEIFLPVFFEDNYIRLLKGGTEYLFIDSEVIRVTEDNINYTCLATRFVKNTTLVSEQKLQGRTLVPDNVSVDTSPSTFILIILETHKVVIFKKNW